MNLVSVFKEIVVDHFESKNVRAKYGERLYQSGLTHLENETDVGYIEARVLEAEGIQFELDGNLQDANVNYINALKIFDRKRLVGECLRVSDRLKNNEMYKEYLDVWRLIQLQQNEFSIVDKYY